nr:truncated recombinant protein III precursor [Filamentous phage display vector G1 fUSE5]
MKKLLFAIPLVVPFYSHSADDCGSGDSWVVSLACSGPKLLKVV